MTLIEGPWVERSGEVLLVLCFELDTTDEELGDIVSHNSTEFWLKGYQAMRCLEPGDLIQNVQERSRYQQERLLEITQNLVNGRYDTCAVVGDQISEHIRQLIHAAWSKGVVVQNNAEEESALYRYVDWFV